MCYQVKVSIGHVKYVINVEIFNYSIHDFTLLINLDFFLFC